MGRGAAGGTRHPGLPRVAARPGHAKPPAGGTAHRPPLAVFLGAAISMLGRSGRRAWLGAAAVVVLAAATVPAMWLRDMVPDNLDRPEELPSYWHDLAAHLDDEGDATRVLELPGIDFANYRWGVTVDPLTPGLMERPYLARELVPYGSPASAALLNAIDGRLQIRTLEPDALAPLARLFRAGTIATRNDLEFEHFNTPRPRHLWQLFGEADGLDAPTSFGDPQPNNPSLLAPMQDELALLSDPTLPDPPPVSVFPVDDAVAIAAAHIGAVPLIVAGDADGLVDLAEAGLLEGDELVHFGADLLGRPDELDAALEQGAVLVVTDTNRRAGQRWGSIRHTRGYTERAGEELLDEDPTDNRLDVFPGSTDDARSIAIATGDLWTTATSYGNAIDFNPAERPMSAVDGDPTTAWRTAAFGASKGERLVVHLPRGPDGQLHPLGADPRRRRQPPDHTGEDHTCGRRSARRGPRADLPQRPGPARGAARHPHRRGVHRDPRRLGGHPRPLRGAHHRGVRRGRHRRPRRRRDHPGAGRPARGRRRPRRRVRSRSCSPASATTPPTRPIPIPRLSSDVSSTCPLARRSGWSARCASRTDAPGPVIDALVGRQGPTVDASATIPGGRRATPSMALDGDPTTAWQTPFGVPADDPWIRVRAEQPFTVEELRLQVRSDQRHSVPTELTLVADGVDLGPVAVPPIAARNRARRHRRGGGAPRPARAGQ